MVGNEYKIMIMTASIGCGHDQAAKVIKDSLLNQYNNIDIEIIDFIELLPSTIGSIIKSTYLKMIDLVPSWYNLLYQGTMKLNQPSKVSNILAYKYKKRIQELIEDSNPDMILFTNPFPSTLVSHLKRKNKINTYTATIITDYTAHSVWLDPTIDSYFVGSNVLKQEMMDSGIEGSKIHITGIPIDNKFEIESNREDTILELGLDINLPTVLIMGGGLGLGSIEEILETTDKIDRELQLIVVAGKNELLKNELQNRAYNPKHKVKVLGFCHNINELMGCSHLLVSKAGGLTMTEAIAKELPVLIFDPIPGQEVKNAQYFSDIGAAMYLEDPVELRNAIEELLFNNPDKRNRMVKCCSIIRKPYASNEISEFIFEKIRNKDIERTPMIQ